jgi:hypothetical protein
MILPNTSTHVFEKIVFVVPRYCDKFSPFYEYMKLLTERSLIDLGIKSEFIKMAGQSTKEYIRNLRKSIVIFLMQPEHMRYLERPKKGCESILWTFEPFKYWERKAVQKYTSMIGPKFDRIWIYDKGAVDHFDNDLISWVPCGFHKCMTVPKTNNKDNKIIFIGNIFGQRNRFISGANSIASSDIVVKRIFNKRLYKTLHHHLHDLERFKYSVYVPLEDVIKSRFVPSHRVVLFSSLKVLNFSITPLEPMLENNKEYILFDGPEDLIEKYYSLENDKNMYNDLINNAYNKIYEQFNMTDILKNEIGKINYSVFY